MVADHHSSNFDVAVVGGGIIGLANAWMAARQGLSVVLFERDVRPQGASIRNFGMIWPIGQPPGHWHQVAMRSRELWTELGAEADIWVNQCGSIHLAYRDDEWTVLEEFEKLSEIENIQLLDKQQILQHSSAVNPQHLIGGLYSESELGVAPADAIAGFSQWLERQCRVCCNYQTNVSRIEGNTVHTSSGRQFRAERIAVCSGSDLETLYPQVFQEAGMFKCKLQMMSTPKQPNGWRLGPHLAGGLTLRHYKCFELCPSLPELKNRIERDFGDYDRFGIHVMASQNQAGHVLLGDSHVYDEEITPFDSNEIEQLILREANTMFRLPDFNIQHRWHGIYVKHPTETCFSAQPEAHVKVISGAGGAGMTLSLGIAEDLWQSW